MHYRDDLGCNRGYEFWLLEQARARNPNIKTYALSWAVNNNNEPMLLYYLSNV